VPAVALTVGWRWAFVAGAMFALGVAPLPPATREPSAGMAPGVQRLPARADYVPMVLLGCAAALATAAVNPLGAFVTSSGVERGLSEGAAGILLASGSAVGMVVRIAAGWLADHVGGHQAVPLVAAMLVVGTAGFGLMALPAVPAYVVGVVLGFGAGYAWQGLFNFAVARQWSFAVATAAGVTQTGLYGGSALGPPLFGMVVDAAGDSAAWLISAVLVAVSAGLVTVIRVRFLAPLGR
jgi:cyanate permease